MLKVMYNFGVYWLTRVFQVAWKTGEVPKQWQTNVLIPVISFLQTLMKFRVTLLEKT